MMSFPSNLAERSEGLASYFYFTWDGEKLIGEEFETEGGGAFRGRLYLNTEVPQYRQQGAPDLLGSFFELSLMMAASLLSKNVSRAFLFSMSPYLARTSCDDVVVMLYAPVDLRKHIDERCPVVYLDRIKRFQFALGAVDLQKAADTGDGSKLCRNIFRYVDRAAVWLFRVLSPAGDSSPSGGYSNPWGGAS